MIDKRPEIYDAQREIDHKDLFTQLLLNIRMIAVIVLIVMVAFTGIWKYISVKAENKTVTDEDVAAAKSLLTDDQASQVEYLYAQYLSYVGYRKTIQAYLSDSLFNDDDYSENISKVSVYSVESSVKNADQLLSRLTLGNDEYEKIADILGKEESMMDDVYRRVSIETLQPSVNGEQFLLVENDNTDASRNTLIQVYVIAENKEQADSITKLVKESLQKEVQLLRSVDSEIKITEVDSNYSSNIAWFVNSRQDNAMTSLNSVNDAINNLQIYYIDKLEGNEKAYYETLKTRDKLKDPSYKIDKPSLLKFLVIGMILGIVIAVGSFIIRYVMDNSIKTAHELSLRYHKNTPVVLTQGNKNSIGNKLAKVLLRKHFSKETVQLPMIASDVGIMLNKNGTNNAYIINSAETELESQVIGELTDILKKQTGVDTVFAGNPLCDPEENERFAEAGVALIMVALKRTLKTEVDKWVELCARYDIPVIEIIALEEI